MFGIRLEDISAQDLQRLTTNDVRENSQLDYKENLPGNDDESKKEFLRDVSALANSNGGYLVYGVRERQEDDSIVAAEIVGVLDKGIDEQKLWMENLIRDSVEPRLLGVRLHTVSIDDSTIVFIVYVPRSWNSPHVVNFKKHWRFYARNSAGNYPMDVTQLRNAFLFRDTLATQLNSFRNERLSNHVPPDRQIPKIVIHIQPFDSLLPESQIDISKARLDSENLKLGSYPTESETRFNFDGLYACSGANPSIGYLQVFRNGVTEEVDSHTLNDEENGKPYIFSLQFQRTVIIATGRRLALLKSLGVSSPVLGCVDITI